MKAAPQLTQTLVILSNSYGNWNVRLRTGEFRVDIPSRSVRSTMRTSPSPLFPPVNRAFSLIELLVVIAILVLLLAVTGSVFQGGAGKLGAATSMASSMLLNARTQAMSMGNGARFVIEAEIDPANRDDFLRRLAVLRAVDVGGVIKWEPVGRSVELPDGHVFATNYSQGYGTMKYAFNGVAGPQDGTTGQEVFFYEFDGAGHLVSSSGSEARIVVAAGRLDDSGGIFTPQAQEARRDGFIVRRAGRLAYFQDTDQIDPVSNP